MLFYVQCDPHFCVLLQSLFDHIPVGVGSKGVIPMNARCAVFHSLSLSVCVCVCVCVCVWYLRTYMYVHV